MIIANVWRGVPFVAITLLAGLQTISPSYYEASAIDGATPWQPSREGLEGRDDRGKLKGLVVAVPRPDADPRTAFEGGHLDEGADAVVLGS